MNSYKEVFDGDIGSEAVQNWLDQFNPSEQAVVRQLLSYFRYYSSNRVFALLKTLYTELVKRYGISPEDTWFVPFGYVAKSGSAIAYFFRRQNNLHQNRFVAAQDLNLVISANTSAVVFLDDFIGSGHDAIRLWNEVVKPLKRVASQTHFIFACMVGYESGIQYASVETQLNIIVAETIPRSEQPFENDSVVYPTSEERIHAREIVENYGRQLSPKEPLGYSGTQALVGFFFSTPNNTLPIFWATEGGWHPLLPHGESLRDPNLLVGLPRGLPEESILRGPRRSLVELEQLQAYDISPDIATRIITEFQSTSIFLVLAPIIRDMGMSHEVFNHLMNLFRKLEYSTHEKEALSTAIIFPDKEDIDKFGEPFVSAGEGMTISDEPEVEALAHLVNGFEGAVVVRQDGRVVGNILFPLAITATDPFLPKRYWAAAIASQKNMAFLVLFAGEGKIVIFHKGIRILSQRHKTWHIHLHDLDRVLDRIESEHGLSHSVVSHVVSTAFEMSDAGYGALFTVGDEAAVLRLSDWQRTGQIHWRVHSVLDMDKRPIISLARQDGATIISQDGKVIQGMAFLRPPAGIEAEQEIGKGSKHDTAAKMSAATKALVVAVSVDGRISLYSKGKLVFKVMG